MKKTYNFITKILPIIISVIALVVSFLSYQTSKQNFEYGVNKDMMINTPAIKEIIDSTNIKFTLNNDNAELQGIQIIFPSSFYDRNLIINTKPVEINKDYLERLATNYLHDLIKKADSTIIVGTFSVPVVIDYSAIVYGFPQQLRENRLLIFNFYASEKDEDVTFSNSFLNGRCGYPLKRHYFYTGLFSSPLEEKVFEQDKRDVQKLLETQLKEIRKNMAD